MPLLYSCVLRGSVVLAAYTPYRSNFEAVALECLQSLKGPREPKFTVVHDTGTTFNFLVKDAYTFLAVADGSFGRIVPFAFLERVAAEFTAEFADRGRTAPAHGLDSTYGPRLQQSQEYCNSHVEEFSQVASLQTKVQEVTHVMKVNVSLLMERGEAITRLQDKAEGLQVEASMFNSKAKKLKCAMCKQYYKMWGILALVLVILAIVIFLCACFAGGRNCTK